MIDTLLFDIDGTLLDTREFILQAFEHSLGKNGRHSHSTCPYCGEILYILTKSFKVQFKTPKVPSEGTNDLNLFYVIPKIFIKKYAICPKCGAKYNYDMHKLTYYQNTLSEIPSSTVLYNDFVYKELLKYPRNTTCELLLRKTYCQKVLIKKSSLNILNQFYKLISILI